MWISLVSRCVVPSCSHICSYFGTFLAILSSRQMRYFQLYFQRCFRGIARLLEGGFIYFLRSLITKRNLTRETRLHLLTLLNDIFGRKAVFVICWKVINCIIYYLTSAITMVFILFPSSKLDNNASKDCVAFAFK